jgi:hypothetical protein
MKFVFFLEGRLRGATAGDDDFVERRIGPCRA